MIDRFFPTLIGFYDNPHHDLIEKKVVNRCYELENATKKGGENWLAKTTYNTIGTYNIWTDNKFKPINDFVLESIKEYLNECRIKQSCLNTHCYDAWFNVYKKGDYQEYHHHGGSLISAVYFLKTNTTSAKIYFKSPLVDMISPEYDEYNPDNYQRVYYEPRPGLLLVFRSYLEHSVEKQVDDAVRISLAYNFQKNNL
tara:strand:- start:2174 stop:2767 length:594 start_codon:yes stop_codon:yes gene_type:complete